MRKRDLLRRCTELYEQLQQESLKNEQLTGELARCREELARLSAAQKTSPALEEPAGQQIVRPAAGGEAALPQEITDGAQVIGRIVVSAAECANRLTVGGNSEYRELVNLILGHTEIAKAKILEIVSSGLLQEEKRARLERCYAEAIEYFESVMQQRGE